VLERFAGGVRERLDLDHIGVQVLEGVARASRYVCASGGAACSGREQIFDSGRVGMCQLDSEAYW
jgi:hypothetical protein